jgi:iron complex outermembrane receptor protein
MSNYTVFKFMCGTGLLCLMAAPAFAQEVPGKITKPTTTIETVVVTAERRAENVQDVPIAMSAISGEDLDKRGLHGFSELTFHTPGLHFAPSTEGGENQVSLRGVGNVNVQTPGDSPVAYLVDGVYMGRSTSVDPEFFDVDRIEVLRGPQGTLYGRNSLGGSVNIITNQPKDELAGHVDARIGDYNARTFRGWANVPLYDCGDCQILARIVGVSAKHDAYQKNLSQAPTATHNSDAQDYALLRGSLLFKFNADVDLRLSGSTSSNDAPVAFKIGQQWAPGDAYTLLGAIPNPTDPRKVYKDYPETYKQRDYSASATLNWNFGLVRFASITGWASEHWRGTFDADGSSLNRSSFEPTQMEQHQISEEVHLASTDES